LDSQATRFSGPGSRIPELDGLRGIAIISVLLVHYFYYPQPGLALPLHLFQRTFALGWSGVDLFFVLSGFLIGGILMDHRDSPSYFKTFYLRRAFRILPIYYLWIFLFIAFILAGGPFLRSHMHSGTLPSLNFNIYQHFLFLQNLWDFNYTTVAYWWLSPTWSLAVEEQFYLVAPLVVRYLPHRLLPAVLGAVIALAPVLRVLVRLFSNAEVPWAAYRLMPCRADSLAVGILLAYVWRNDQIRTKVLAKPSRLYLALLTLLLGVGVIWWRYPNPNDPVTQSIGYSVIALFYGVLLLVAIGFHTGPVAKFTRLGILREFGRVSYCLYLIHEAVGYFCSGLLTGRIMHFTDWKNGLVGLLSLIIAYGIARLSWTYFEHPLLMKGHQYKY